MIRHDGHPFRIPELEQTDDDDDDVDDCPLNYTLDGLDSFQWFQTHKKRLLQNAAFKHPPFLFYRLLVDERPKLPILAFLIVVATNITNGVCRFSKSINKLGSRRKAADDAALVLDMHGLPCGVHIK